MSVSGVGEEIGAQGARSRALAVLRVRGRAAALALLPAAAAVVLLAGGATGLLTGGSWDTTRWIVTAVAVLVLLCAAAVATVIVRAEPALSPTVEIAEHTAPDLYRLVRDLADRLGVPAPSSIALTPDCDSWLEDRTHPAHAPADSAADPATNGAARAEATASGRAPAKSVGMPGAARRRVPAAPVLVIGSPFLWWMRVAELRAVLAPVVAGTGPASHPDIAAARRFVRSLDAAAALADRRDPGRPVRRTGLRLVSRIARLMLRACAEHTALMERGVASAASERAHGVDYGLRIVAQEQVGLAYAGWDRLLTRVALPAWRMGRWPSRLDVGVVSALTELSRRDRLAEGFASRLGERPACDLLEEPGAVDEATSLLAARLFHGGPAESGPDWSPVDWQQYPEEVVDRKWRTEAARLHRVLDGMGVRRSARPGDATAGPAAVPAGDAVLGPTLDRVMDHLAGRGEEAGDSLAAGISAEVAREEAEAVLPAQPAAPEAAGDALALRGADPLPLLPLMPPRTGRELLADHVTAMVCCAAVDTAGATPGLDWLDGPALLMDGKRRTDLAGGVLSLVEDGDGEPLRMWLAATGVRSEKPVRLV
ncbi:hypothetical protein OG875_16240 [Streptomyces sp. NBC_01498]|uniref:hypothetical protein n=1 Tax=Streptomyces sp. NBC_01498 TaxID=2975870 RepID=UPI002E7B6751|nr:hypothetical protein [Streptomyces sp. NBC_01498]WTL26012.1 hypothetical protein OG875_16240 [Streptomyces sp. NBC_01498]